ACEHSGSVRREIQRAIGWPNARSQPALEPEKIYGEDRQGLSHFPYVGEAFIRHQHRMHVILDHIQGCIESSRNLVLHGDDLLLIEAEEKQIWISINFRTIWETSRRDNFHVTSRVSST